MTSHRREHGWFDAFHRRCDCDLQGADLGLSRRSVLTGLAATSIATHPFAAMAQGAPETPKLTVGYVPVTCATPILAAHAFGFFKAEGLDVELARTPSWALVRDRLVNGEYDASQLILPMPLAISMGIGSVPTPLRVAVIDNINGSGLVLHKKHKDRRDPKDWKGFKFGVPFEQSVHNLLLRYFLAEGGLNPDKDVEIRVMAPADTVTSMQVGNIDGMFFAEPWGQRAVFEGAGFFHILSKDILPGHACCSVAVAEVFAADRPNTYAALVRALAKAIDYAATPTNIPNVAETLSSAAYFNQPKSVLTQVLTGRYADGLGQIRSVPDRIQFRAKPNDAVGVWMLTQMKRWGYISGTVNYEETVKRVFASDKAAAIIDPLHLKNDQNIDPNVNVMDKMFDVAAPDKYLQSFTIRKSI